VPIGLLRADRRRGGEQLLQPAQPKQRDEIPRRAAKPDAGPEPARCELEPGERLDGDEVRGEGGHVTRDHLCAGRLDHDPKARAERRDVGGPDGADRQDPGAGVGRCWRRQWLSLVLLPKDRSRSRNSSAAPVPRRPGPYHPPFS
jgi:hypothetical protein